jgi:hypothetical protein
MTLISEDHVAQQLTDIPADQVGVVVQDFIDNGAVKVRVERQPNGKFTITAP